MDFANYLPVWNKLENPQREAIVSAAVHRTFDKGELLRGGSDDCTGLMLVCSGQIRAYTVSEDGREITLYRLFEGDICLLSASCMISSIQFNVFIEAEKESKVFVIPSEIYKNIMEVSAPLANYTSEVMASRFSDVMWLMEQVLWKSFDRRLAEFLINEANIEGAPVLHITHEIIGHHLGNPREVVTRMLKYFQNEGLVKLSRGTIELRDISGLNKMISK